MRRALPSPSAAPRQVLRDKRSFVEGQLARAQAEITSEQHEEIKKVFYHFDKTKDGLLNQLEFAAAIKAMDFEIGDHEQQPTFLRFAKEGQRAEEPAAMTIDLSGFTTFVLQQYKDNDTKDTLFAAFETARRRRRRSRDTARGRRASRRGWARVGCKRQGHAVRRGHPCGDPAGGGEPHGLAERSCPRVVGGPQEASEHCC